MGRLTARRDAPVLLQLLLEAPPYVLVGLAAFARHYGQPLAVVYAAAGMGLVWQVVAMRVLRDRQASEGVWDIRVNNLGRLAVISVLLLWRWRTFTPGLGLLACSMAVLVVVRCLRYPQGPRPQRRWETNLLRGQ